MTKLAKQLNAGLARSRRLTQAMNAASLLKVSATQREVLRKLNDGWTLSIEFGSEAVLADETRSNFIGLRYSTAAAMQRMGLLRSLGNPNMRVEVFTLSMLGRCVLPR